MEGNLSGRWLKFLRSAFGFFPWPFRPMTMMRHIRSSRSLNHSPRLDRHAHNAPLIRHPTLTLPNSLNHPVLYDFAPSSPALLFPIHKALSSEFYEPYYCNQKCRKWWKMALLPSFPGRYDFHRHFVIIRKSLSGFVLINYQNYDCNWTKNVNHIVASHRNGWNVTKSSYWRYFIKNKSFRVVQGV